MWQLALTTCLKNPTGFQKLKYYQEQSVSLIPNFKQSSLSAANTLDKIILVETGPNEHVQKKEENKVDTLMDTLNENLTETKEGLIPPEIETDIYLDLVQFENDKKHKDFDTSNDCNSKLKRNKKLW